MRGTVGGAGGDGGGRRSDWGAKARLGRDLTSQPRATTSPSPAPDAAHSRHPPANPWGARWVGWRSYG
eukprot:3542405-Pleurochrysis_carterae.AAC.1